MTTWMNLTEILLNEISQTEKDSIMWYHLYEKSKKKPNKKTNKWNKTGTDKFKERTKVARAQGFGKTDEKGEWGWEDKRCKLPVINKQDLG